MKNIFVVVFLLPFFARAQSKIGVQSVKIEYAFDDVYSHGTKTVIFSDSGRFVRSMTTVTTDSLPMELAQFHKAEFPQVSHLLTIQTSDSTFSIDMDSMRGASQVILNFNFMMGMVYDNMKKIDTAIYLGKNCEVYEYLGFTIWIW